MKLVLSLFPGIGLLDMAFEAEGFCVVRGPDLLWGGDVRKFHPPNDRFDGVIGGPPCQAFSQMVHMVRANGYVVAENLIPEFERVVAEAAPAWFLMENVPAAPLPNVPGYSATNQIFNNRWTGAEQNRVRRFSFGTRGDGLVRLELGAETVALETPVFAPAVCAGGSRRTPVRISSTGKQKSTFLDGDALPLAEAMRLQGLPADFELPGFTAAAKRRAIGNGVPIHMGRAFARAVRRALGLPIVSAESEAA